MNISNILPAGGSLHQTSGTLFFESPACLGPGTKSTDLINSPHFQNNEFRLPDSTLVNSLVGALVALLPLEVFVAHSYHIPLENCVSLDPILFYLYLFLNCKLFTKLNRLPTIKNSKLKLSFGLLKAA
jgi:hypothetical protein